jgi:hypothetical protein
MTLLTKDKQLIPLVEKNELCHSIDNTIISYTFLLKAYNRL